eukprot:10855778-Alexandrium_andersonii.AAC.1
MRRQTGALPRRSSITAAARLRSTGVCRHSHSMCPADIGEPHGQKTTPLCLRWRWSLSGSRSPPDKSKRRIFS